MSENITFWFSMVKKERVGSLPQELRGSTLVIVYLKIGLFRRKWSYQIAYSIHVYLRVRVSVCVHVCVFLYAVVLLVYILDGFKFKQVMAGNK